MNAIWRKKSVFDPLTQTVLVDRIPEVEIRVAVVITKRCGSHAELSSWFEVFKNLAPVTLVARAAAMTFIDDDQVEKVRRVFFIQALAPFIFCQRLINRKIDFTTFYRLAIFDLRACIAELGEDFVLGIVDQNVAIREIQNLRTTMLTRCVPARVPKFPA